MPPQPCFATLPTPAPVKCLHFFFTHHLHIQLSLVRLLSPLPISPHSQPSCYTVFNFQVSAVYFHSPSAPGRFCLLNLEPTPPPIPQLLIMLIPIHKGIEKLLFQEVQNTVHRIIAFKICPRLSFCSADLNLQGIPSTSFLNNNSSLSNIFRPTEAFRGPTNSTNIVFNYERWKITTVAKYRHHHLPCPHEKLCRLTKRNLFCFCRRKLHTSLLIWFAYYWKAIKQYHQSRCRHPIIDVSDEISIHSWHYL